MRRLFVILILLTLAASALAQDWPAPGNDPGGARFAPLTQLTRKTVRKLRLVWQKSPVQRRSVTEAAGTQWPATPIVVGGRLYVCVPGNQVIALDAQTGDELWRAGIGTAAEDAGPAAEFCPGLAYWAEPKPADARICQRRVFGLAPAGGLWALDADNGNVCEGFDAGNGRVDAGAHRTGGIAGSSAPVVFEDQVIVALAGRLQAYDTRTGKPEWLTELAPSASQADAAKAYLSVDAVYGQVLVSMAGSVMALNARTGEPAWRHELLRGAPPGYELAGDAVAVRIDKDDRKRDVAVQRVSTGDVFVFDRRTGKPVFPIQDSGEPGQPRSSGIRPVSPQTLSVEQMFGLSIFDRDGCRRAFRDSRYEGLFTPPSEQGSIIYPAPVRGGGAAAFDASRNLLLVRSGAVAQRLWQLPTDDAGRLASNKTTLRAEAFVSVLGLPCTPPPWGLLTAIDMQTGEHRWQIPIGQYRYDGVSLPDASGWGAPDGSAPMVTGSGLVFVASGRDARLRAFDVRNGRQLWSRELSAPSMTTPISYEAGGRQFVLAVTTDNSMLAFALPKQ